MNRVYIVVLLLKKAELLYRRRKLEVTLPYSCLIIGSLLFILAIELSIKDYLAPVIDRRGKRAVGSYAPNLSRFDWLILKMY